MEEFVVLSLFDGMSCCQIALNRVGRKPTTYYASEIEKKAMEGAQINYPDTIQLGDVRDIDVSKLKPIQLLAGGSPCQSFSFAGKRKGMATKCEIEILKLETYLELKSQGFEFEGQSYLFWEYVRILQDIRKYNPDVKFLLENVEMGAKWERVLSEAIAMPGVHINSSLVSAQVRKRIYWTNIRTKKAGLFGDIQPDIPLPADKGILLKHILEKQVAEKYYLSEKAISRIVRKGYSDPKVNPEKTGALNTKNNSGQLSVDSETTLITESGIGSSLKVSTSGKADPLKAHGGCSHDQMVATLITDANCVGNIYDNGHDSRAGRVYTTDGKGVALISTAGGGGAKTGLYVVDGEKSSDSGCSHDQMVTESTGVTNNRGELSSQDKANCIDANYHKGMDNHAQRTMIAEPDPVCVAMRGRNPENPSDRTTGAPTEQRLEPKTDGKTNCLTSVAKDNLIIQSAHGYNNGDLFEGKSPAQPAQLTTSYNNIAVGTRIRRLTPIECCRLQNVPDDYFFKDGKYIISETAVYKCLGNGWTIDVIAHIFQYLP